MDKHSQDDSAGDVRIEIGHVHLRVADLDRATAFYQGIIGFEITQPIGHGGILLSAGGHHPQIVLNAQLDEHPGAAATGPCRFAVRYPNREALGRLLRRLTSAGVPVDGALDHGLSESLYVRDPDGNAVELYYDRPANAWPRIEGGAIRTVSQPLDLQALRVFAEQASSAGPLRGDSSDRAPSMSEATRTRLREMRVRLLNLHKALLEDTKAAYEMDRGRVGNNASLLQLVINDPWFAWLHPLSELVVRIDETLQPEAPVTESDGVALLEQVERLISPAQSAASFAQRYYDALQRQPAVVVAHAEVRRILKQSK